MDYLHRKASLKAPLFLIILIIHFRKKDNVG